MGKHSAKVRPSVRTVASLLALSVGVFALPVEAAADEVDDLIAEMDALSEEATSKSEELKAAEDEIRTAEERLDALRERVSVTRDEATAAHDAREEKRRIFDGIAVAESRNSRSDLVMTSLGAQNPQTLIDRAAYLGALSRKTDRALEDLREANRLAAERANRANIAVAEAEYQRMQLDAKREKLEREQADLEESIRAITEKVDALTPEQRLRWMSKGHPIDSPLAVLTGVGGGVVSAAMAELGKPYGWGAAGPDAFDCSGLMVWAYAQNGKSIPRTSQAQLAGGTPVPLSELEPGDIVGYYPGTTHVGMYIGNGQVVHASDYGIPVQVVAVDSMPIQGAVRY